MLAKRLTPAYLTSFLALLVGAYFLAMALAPKPIPVSLGRAEKGSMQVTVDEEGETRIHDRYTLSAVVSGRLRRIELHDGDAVVEGQVLAELEPLPLSVRDIEEQRARVAAAEASRREAEFLVKHVASDYEQAKRDQKRQERLFNAKLTTAQLLEQARIAATTLASELEAARYKVLSAAAQVRLASAALVAIDGSERSGIKPIQLRSSIKGQVLRLHEKSARVVSAGTPIMTLGDPRQLEVVIDVLSTDAVRVRPGMLVHLERWGGDGVLRAQVRTVEPYAFTKVSALGIEEQRVNVVADLIDGQGQASHLGDAYRVEARIVIWQADQVLKIVSGALFRHGEDWSVYVDDNGRAQRRTVEVGHRNAAEAEILNGLQPGDVIIEYPSNDIQDGVRIVDREK